MSEEFQSIAILGRQPALGRAELESVYGAQNIQPFGDHALLTLKPEVIDADRLGGSIRIAKILRELPNNWRKIDAILLQDTPKHAENIDGKLTFGVSVFGVDVNKKDIARTALNMKKAIKKAGNSVRMVPHDGLELNAATVLYNKLTGPQGWELIIVSDGRKTYLAQTTHIQDIDAYAARDRERPMRDAKVGMLPPKLAQIITNLAVSDSDPKHGGVVLDPFCGTGVLMQEASLMGFDVYGTDIEPRMVEYTTKNFEWLRGDEGYRKFEVADATSYTWSPTPKIVAGETFLGQPLATLPPSDQLAKIMTDANAINHKFLQNISSQITSGTRLCLAVPTWRGKREFLHLSALDYLDEMGYTRLEFKHAVNNDLIYHRDNQVVGRELLVLEKR